MGTLDAFLLPGKLVPPAVQGLARPRLRGAATPDGRVLVAGAGYGKTWALAQLAADDGAFTIWYTLDALDADPSHTFAHLLSAARHHIPPFDPGFESELRAETPDPARIWRRFFAAFAPFGLPAVRIVLDDLHHLAPHDPRWARALGPCLDTLPPGIQVLVASRQAPFPLARARSRGHVQVLKGEELRFDATERLALLQAAVRDGPPPEGWVRLAEQLEGWPLGFKLLTARSPHAALPAFDAGESELADCVAEEFYLDQPPALQALMLRAALLDEVDLATMAALAPATAQALEALVERQLLQPLSDGSYRFPTFLRAFLRGQATRTLGSDLPLLHRAAAVHLEATGRLEQALTHRLAVGDWDAALALAQTVFPTLLANGRHVAAGRLVRAFPDDLPQPWLAYAQGLVWAREGRNDESGLRYVAAREGYQQAGDEAGELKVVVRLCGLALLGRVGSSFNQLLWQAQALAGQALALNAEDLADLHLLRALAADQRGDMALVKECNEAVLTLDGIANPEVAACRVIARMNLFTLAWNEGELTNARLQADAARREAETHGFGPAGLYAGFMRARVDLEVGDRDEVSAFVHALPDDWDTALDWHDRGGAWVVLGSYHLARGAYKEAEAALGRALEVFRGAGFIEGEKLPLERLMWLAIARHQPARALGLVPPGEAENSIYDLNLAIALARARHLTGDVPTALADWGRIVPGLEALGATLQLARARLYEAACRQAGGDRPGALHAFAEATRLIDRKGYTFLWQHDPALTHELAGLSTNEPTAAPAPSQALSLRLVGPFEAFIGERELTTWPRRKAKLTLAALALAPRGLPLETLAEAIGAAIQTPAICARCTRCCFASSGCWSPTWARAKRRASSPARTTGTC